MKLSPKSLRMLSWFVGGLENPRDQGAWKTWCSGPDSSHDLPPRIIRIAKMLADTGIIAMREHLEHELPEDEGADAANDLELLKSIRQSLEPEQMAVSQLG